MKSLTLSLWLAVCATVTAADPNRLPQDEAQRYAKVCVEQATTLSDAQVKMEVDPDKACAVRGEGGGAMIVPDKKLSAELLVKVGQDVVPIGQLWLRKWTSVVAAKPTPAEKLRLMTVNVDDKDRPMPLFFLGVRKKPDKDLELVVYAKEVEPLMVLPLIKADMAQELPVELQWNRGDKDIDSLTLGLFGKYQAVIPITREVK